MLVNKLQLGLMEYYYFGKWILRKHLQIINGWLGLPPAALIILLSSLLVWAVGNLTMFKVLNGVVYDHMLVSSSPLKSQAKPEVVIINVTKDSIIDKSDTSLVLLREIEKEKPKLVVFTYMPINASANFYQEASSYGNVIFGRHAYTDINNPDALVIETWPSNATGIELTSGVFKLPESSYGIYRAQQTSFQLNNQVYPSLEWVASNHFFNRANAPLKEERFNIDFSRGASIFPEISIERALSGDVIPELIKDKVVMIGLSEAGNTPLHTPLEIKNKAITPLQFHAYALETLLTNNIVNPVRGPWILLIIVLSISISLLTLQWMPKRFSLVVLIAFLSLYTLFTWLIIILGRIWLPLVEIWFAQLISFILFIRYRDLIEEEKFWKIILHESGKLWNKLIPESIYASQEHWSNIVAMVNQTLDLDRTIFLECIANTHKIREIIAFNCSLEDISEQRRDYHRTPYSLAIEKKQLIRVENYLAGGVKDEQQFLFPLIFLGEVLGFWVLCLNPEKTMSPSTESFLVRVGTQISEVLYYRNKWMQQQKISKNVFFSYLNLEANDRVAEDLQKILSLMERRLTTIEDYINAQSTASILYDLFGRASIANKQMITLLKNSNILLYNITALDLLISLTGISFDEGKRALQTIILNGSDIEYQVVLPGNLEKTFTLRLSALNIDADKHTLESDTISAIERQGFLCELIDITEIEHASNEKGVILEHLACKLIHELGALGSILPSSKSETDVVARISGKINILSRLVSESTPFFDSKLNLSQMKFYPVDIKKVISSVMSSSSEKNLMKNITFSTDETETLSLVYATSKGLAWVVFQLLKYLKHDAQTGSEITIRLSASKDNVICLFSNAGFGIPNERFQEYLNGYTPGKEQEHYEVIKEAIKLVKSWDGELDGTSELGQGISFSLVLKKFLY